MERWRPVEGWPYEVSDRGRVRHAKTKRVRRLDRTSSPYDRVQFWRTRPWNFYVHHLVAAAFLGRAPGPIGRGVDQYQVNHRDGHRRHNAPGNLEWCTRAENSAHAARTGLQAHGERIAGAILTVAGVRHIRDRVRQGDRQRGIASEFGVSPATVSDIKHGRTWRHVA